MKKIVLIFVIVIIISLIYILNQLEIPLLNKTLTEENIITLTQRINESNLNDQTKTKIIMNIIIQNKNCYGKKIKDLM